MACHRRILVACHKSNEERGERGEFQYTHVFGGASLVGASSSYRGDDVREIESERERERESTIRPFGKGKGRGGGGEIGGGGESGGGREREER